MSKLGKRRKFQRQSGYRRYRKIFILATEGAQTEPQYFSIFNNEQSVIRIKCLQKGHDSSLIKVLKKMENYLKEEGLKNGDEAWLVIDRDQWNEKQLEELSAWALKKKNHGLALSNPKFEYWLLLHFEEGNNIKSSADCDERLKRYLPNYDKRVDKSKFTRDRIDKAAERARLRDNPPCVDWPRKIGNTTVYRLVENIFNADTRY